MITHHTRGPWKVKPATLNVKDPMFYKADVICGGIRIALVAGVGEEEANANAALIAAAPELLKGCHMALDELDAINQQEFGADAMPTRTMQKIQDAIDKTMGG